ncbi:MAG TPA: hypothetical protein VM431_04155 [Phycisphaerae bacterium]|nr:hypothetical protein [Phycisphaerae bacterium]
MGEPQPHRPTSLQKLLFWAILGGLSVFFAEITIGSSPFAFFDGWGILVLCIRDVVRTAPTQAGLTPSFSRGRHGRGRRRWTLDGRARRRTGDG